MAKAAAAATRPGPRPSTSRDEIVRITIELLDRDGPDSLTFRGVARELGVAVGALSRYFRNLQDLRDAVTAQISAGVRPLAAKSKRELRQQLVRLGMDWLEVNRAHPYLLTIHGSASAAVIARHVSQGVKVLVACGVDFERAMVIYSIVTNLAHAWGVELARQQDPALQAAVVQAFTDESAELAPQLTRLAAAYRGGMQRRALELVVDGLLP
ncbi:MAG TPA: helix-turn-helix domain-containing protein [Nevskiaceae bacterium]|nr:helix-turn-helix domain-containing protein [Nevskiaceae bacterium]